MKSPYQSGWNAGYDGRPETNPYLMGTPEDVEWLLGFDDGELAYEQDRLEDDDMDEDEDDIEEEDLDSPEWEDDRLDWEDIDDEE